MTEKSSQEGQNVWEQQASAAGTKQPDFIALLQDKCGQPNSLSPRHKGFSLTLRLCAMGSTEYLRASLCKLG